MNMYLKKKPQNTLQSNMETVLFRLWLAKWPLLIGHAVILMMCTLSIHEFLTKWGGHPEMVLYAYVCIYKHCEESYH